MPQMTCWLGDSSQKCLTELWLKLNSFCLRKSKRERQSLGIKTLKDIFYWNFCEKGKFGLKFKEMTTIWAILLSELCFQSDSPEFLINHETSFHHITSENW